MKSALSFSLAPQVLVQGEWLHVDPCEAAVGEKRMYVVRSPRPAPARPPLRKRGTCTRAVRGG